MKLATEVNDIFEAVSKEGIDPNIHKFFKDQGWKYHGEAVVGRVYRHKDLKGHMIVHHNDNEGKPTNNWTHYDNDNNEVTSGKKSGLNKYLSSQSIKRLKSDVAVNKYYARQ